MKKTTMKKSKKKAEYVICRGYITIRTKREN